VRQRWAQSGMVRLSDAFKAVGPATTFLFLTALSCTVLALSRFEPTSIDRVRGLIIDGLAPVLDALSRPIDVLRDLSAEIQGHLNLKAENERLAEEVERLRSWQATARRLTDENRDLRSLTGLPNDPLASFASARVVADSGGPFIRTVLIGAGERDGVRRGQAVATGDGVVGRVVGTGHRAARVLLLTDLNSRIPIVIQGTRLRAMLVGDNSARPRLEYLPSGATITPGDRVVTSGDGGLFPEGLPIGVVTAVESHVPRVQLFVDLERLDFVRIFRFAMPLEIDERAPSVIAAPPNLNAAPGATSTMGFLTPPMVPMIKPAEKAPRDHRATPPATGTADTDDSERQE